MNLLETAMVPRIFTDGLNFFLSILSDLFTFQATKFKGSSRLEN
jgi:hypothetical protein